MLPKITTKAVGDAAESMALSHLQRQGLRLLERNYRTPGRGGGEIDLICQDRDGTLVFVEVRARASRSRGGAAASVTPSKQQRLIFAAQCYLMRWQVLPPCRFDVVAIHGDHIEWIPSAFDAL